MFFKNDVPSKTKMSFYKFPIKKYLRQMKVAEFKVPKFRNLIPIAIGV